MITLSVSSNASFHGWSPGTKAYFSTSPGLGESFLQGSDVDAVLGHPACPTFQYTTYRSSYTVWNGASVMLVA